MLQIYPLNKSFSQKLQCPEKKIKAINPPKMQLFEQSSCSKSRCKFFGALNIVLFKKNTAASSVE